MQEKNNKKYDQWINLWRIIGAVVILGFFIFSILSGGTAFLGYQENGHFFVRDHADVVEVSELIWRISHVWGILFSVFIPLTPIVEYIISKVQKKKKR